MMCACVRLSVDGVDDDLYGARCGASSPYADNACRPATAAVVIATSDVTDYHDDDGRTVLTSHAPVMATNCLCRYDDSEHVDGGGCVLSARLGVGQPSRSSGRLKSRPDHASPDYQGDHLVRPS